MAGQRERDAGAVGADPGAADGGEHLLRRPVPHQDLVQPVQHRTRAEAGEDQPAPGRPQGDTHRRLVRAVPGNVADQRGDRAVGQLQRVVEVRPEQCPLLTRLVAGAQQECRVVQ